MAQPNTTVDQRGQRLLMEFCPKGRRPAGVAAAKGEMDVLDDLITEDALNAEAADTHKDTPLHLAAMFGRYDVVKVCTLTALPACGLQCVVFARQPGQRRRICQLMHPQHCRLH